MCKNLILIIWIFTVTVIPAQAITNEIKVKVRGENNDLAIYKEDINSIDNLNSISTEIILDTKEKIKIFDIDNYKKLKFVDSESCLEITKIDPFTFDKVNCEKSNTIVIEKVVTSIKILQLANYKDKADDLSAGFYWQIALIICLTTTFLCLLYKAFKKPELIGYWIEGLAPAIIIAFQIIGVILLILLFTLYFPPLAMLARASINIITNTK